MRLIEWLDEAEMSRRGFLGQAGKGLAAVAAGSAANAMGGGRRGVAGHIGFKKSDDYIKSLEKQYKPEGKEGSIVGIHKFETKFLAKLLVPRNEEEKKPFQEFFQQIHGPNFRNNMSLLIRALDIDSGIDLQKPAAEFLQRHMQRAGQYAGGKPTVKFSSTHKGSNYRGGVNLNPFDNEVGMPIAGIAGHEAGHAMQDPGFMRGSRGNEGYVAEIVSFFDGVLIAALANNLVQSRKAKPSIQQALDKFLKTPLKFPGGSTSVGFLVNQFQAHGFDQKQIEDTVMKKLASPAGVTYFERLMYGPNRNSSGIMREFNKQTNVKRPPQEQVMAKYLKDEYTDELEYFNDPKAAAEYGKEETAKAAIKAQQKLRDIPNIIAKLKRTPGWRDGWTDLDDKHSRLVMVNKIKDDPYFQKNGERKLDDKHKFYILDRLIASDKGPAAFDPR